MTLKYVRHVHLSYNEALPEFNGINRGLEQGITYSIGVNPFSLPEFSESFQHNGDRKVSYKKSD